MKYWFHCFGLRVASDIDLCGRAASPGQPDLVLRVRRVRHHVAHVPAVQWGRDQARRLSWAILPALARVEAHHSGEVLIEAAEDVDADSLRFIAVTVALPLALHQRPGLVLEASAILWQGQALVIVGRGYCGKSTLAALMADQGAELLADSHCLLTLSESGGLVLGPALPHIRLWPAQAQLLGPEWPAPVALRPGLSKSVFVVPERFASDPEPVRGLIVLRRGVDSQSRQHRLPVRECLQALAVAGSRLVTSVNPDQNALRFSIMTKLAALPICHLLQWPRWGESELETRSTLLELLAGQDWGVAA